MAIHPTCNVCNKELKEFGGLIFSPPDKNNSVKKYHLCKNCFKKLEKALKKDKDK